LIRAPAGSACPAAGTELAGSRCCNPSARTREAGASTSDTTSQQGHIVVDPGHGGWTAAGSSTPFGQQGASGVLEKDVNLALAHRVAELGRGTVSLTRTADVNLTLGGRCQVGRQADVFVSLHSHAGGGAEVLTHRDASPASVSLARCIRQELVSLDPRTPPVRGGDLAVLHPSYLGGRTAACMVEADLLSGHGSDLDRVAGAVLRGIDRHRSQPIAEGQIEPATIAIGIAIFSLIVATEYRTRGALRWRSNTAKVEHSYPAGRTRRPYSWRIYQPILNVDSRSGLSSATAHFVAEGETNYVDIGRISVDLNGSTTWTRSDLNLTFEVDAAPGEEDRAGDGIARVYVDFHGGINPMSIMSDAIQISGRVMVGANLSVSNKYLKITSGARGAWDISSGPAGGYKLQKR